MGMICGRCRREPISIIGKTGCIKAVCLFTFLKTPFRLMVKNKLTRELEVQGEEQVKKPRMERHYERA